MRVLQLAERWQRAAFAQSRWAGPAKEAVQFFEGDQYTQEQIAKLRAEGRPHFKFNIIAPIVRLVIGYQANNKTDIKFSPGDDGMASQEVATALTQLEKSIATNSEMEFVDAEVFLEGLLTGRGFYRTLIDWENNDLGEVKTTSYDPFAVFIDPDADTYDLNKSAGYVQTSKFVSIDEIEGALGRKVADLVRPFTMGQTPLAPVSSLIVSDEITPVRTFGQREDSSLEYWDNFYSLMGDFVDPLRKTIRIIETEHKVREPRNVVIDLETGDKKVLPVTWGQDRIQKLLLHAEVTGNPLMVQNRLVERIQWTTMVGDYILYDEPSFYDEFSIAGYFPYFRRGKTRGMVEDLVDPQKEKNKSRNARIEIESKTANGGWKFHESSLTPDEERKLRKFGSAPGYNMKWKGDKSPELIQASQPSMAYEKLERQSDEDARRISGVNESALGDTDLANQSGRAIEARQRQAVISVQMYMSNMRRTKRIVGRSHLQIVQSTYTEPRMYRVTGDDGKKSPLTINQMLVDPNTGAKRILNDVTVGKYTAVVDDTPLSATFAAAQFEEMMSLLEKLGPAIGPALPMLADLIIGMSSLPRKDEWAERLQAALGTGAQPVGAPAGPPGAPQPGGSNVVPMQPRV